VPGRVRPCGAPAAHSDLISGLGTAARDRGDLPTGNGVVLRFGEFELHERAHELIRAGKHTRLQEQPFQVLRALLEHAGQVVTREQLRQRLWPSSVYVDFDHGLNNAMGRLREVLGDAIAAPRYIETLPKLGYRFICPVERREPPTDPIPAAPPRRRTRARVLGLLAVLIVLAISWTVASRWRHVTDAPHASAAVHDPEAQRLYAMGIMTLRGRGLDRDPELAAGLFQQALARDPQYAAAYAGLALYHFHEAWAELRGVEEHTRAGRLATEQAMSLEPGSGEPLLAQANFEAWQSRSRGDFAAYERAVADFRRTLEVDPANSAAYFYFARAIVWDEPRLSQQMFARAVEIDPLWDVALSFSALLLSQRGQHDAARTRLADLEAHTLRPEIYALTRGVLELELGHLDEAAVLLENADGLDAMQLWSVYLSLGDSAAAARELKTLDSSEVTAALREAMTLSAQGKAGDAFTLLDPHCNDFPQTLLLDLPTARLALIAGQPARARELLTRRLPDLARGTGPVRARNVIPALDLAAAYRATGSAADAKRLLARIAAYLDGPDAPRWPMFTYLRARTHVLADEPEEAILDLRRAYDAGFRQLWALDLHPQPLLYIDGIDQDPAFASLRADRRYRAWREQIRADNARQLAHLRTKAHATGEAD
jgi:DNA-binding winged helix-turn-helix (wHTH) protein